MLVLIVILVILSIASNVSNTSKTSNSSNNAGAVSAEPAGIQSPGLLLYPGTAAPGTDLFVCRVWGLGFRV